MTMKTKTNISDLFSDTKANNTYVKVCAPMVRYSKIQYRSLVRRYGVDLCFTPMIIADSFCQNAKARSNEFTTTISDSPLVVQFAANNPNDFVDAAKLIYPYSDGVDINCGCPQRWAMKDGYGCALLSKPEMISDMVKQVRRSLSNTFSVSVKIRILKDIKHTFQLCQQLEKCGVTFVTVHGRTPEQKSNDDINTDVLRNICDLLDIPVVINGGVKTLDDSDDLYDKIKCDGVMAASGLLTNPALFAGASSTPMSCIKEWIDMKEKYPNKISFQVYHHHLVFMLEKILSRRQKQVFNYLRTFESVDNYLYDNILNTFDNTYLVDNLDDFINCDFDSEITLKHSSKCKGCGRSICYCVCCKYDNSISDGVFFSSFVRDNDDIVYMDSNLFE